MRGPAGVAIVLLVLALAPPVALASQRFSDVDVRQPTLQVNRAGIALVQYTRATGVPRHVLVWGALDARAPDPGARQVRFRFDYAGGYRAFHSSSYWRRFRNVCRPYAGPPLAHYVAACTAPDGTFWALQAWQRTLPLLGFAPWLASQSAVELHVSHWSGELSRFDVHTHWTYGGRFVGLFGRLTYRGVPVQGFHAAPSGNPRDAFGRNVYIDTFDSAYGPGWRRETAILLHTPTGTFCHSFVPQRPPAGYPSQEVRPSAPGARFRVTAIGPGVTPDVVWEESGLGVYDAAEATSQRSVFNALMAGDAHCVPEH